VIAPVSVLEMVPVQPVARIPLYTWYNHLDILHDILARSVSMEHHRLYKRLSNPPCSLHKNLCK
jgi:hypothetical protein